jgi:peptidoglycan/LPS O-acetylase OafA/YrhL
LTGVRFIAAFWVLCYHAMPRTGLPAPLAALVDGGYAGVSLFFVLSGFILAHAYGEPAASASFPTRAFLGARLARIYPAYLAALLFALPAFAREVTVTPHAPAGLTLSGVGLSTVLMLQAWVPRWGWWWNTPGWSLSVEAFFYVVFPFIAPRLLRLRAATLVGVGLGAWFAALVIAPFASAEFAGDTAWWGADLHRTWLSAWTPLVRLPEFVLGICAARALRTPALAPRVGAVGGSAAVLLILWAATRSPSHLRELLLWPAIALPFAVLIAALANPMHRSPLSHAVFQRLGNASYSLYLIHAVLQGYLLALANRVAGPAWGHSWGVLWRVCGGCHRPLRSAPRCGGGAGQAAAPCHMGMSEGWPRQGWRGCRRRGHARSRHTMPLYSCFGALNPLAARSIFSKIRQGGPPPPNTWSLT